MIDPVPIDERRPPITPQLALRVAVLGGIAFVLFAIIFFRLWYLQVLSGDQYLQQARDNRVREVRVQAPRGDIVDRNGHVLVENRAATVVQIDPESLPAAERNAAATWGQDVTARSRRPKGKKGPLVADPAAGHGAPRGPLQEPRARAEHVAQDDPGARGAVAGVAALRQRDGQGRRRRPAPQLPRRAPRGLPRRRRRAQVPAPLPRALAGGAARGQHRRDRRPGAQAQALQGRHAGDGRRPGRPRARLRPVPARRRRLDEDHHRRARAAQELGAGARPGVRALGAHDARPRAAADRREVPRPDDQPGPRQRRRLRRARPARRQRAGARLLSDRQPVDPLQAVLAGHGRPPVRRQRRRAALQPRHRRLLSDGLDLQADHRAGGHEHRRRAARRRHRRQRLHQDRHRGPGGAATPARRRSGRST